MGYSESAVRIRVRIRFRVRFRVRIRIRIRNGMFRSVQQTLVGGGGGASHKDGCEGD